MNAEGQGRSTSHGAVRADGGDTLDRHPRLPTMDSGAGVGTAGARIACLPFTID